MAVHQNLDVMAEHKKLYNMCRDGAIEEVRMSLARGGDPNKKMDRDGRTALHAAAGQGHQEVVALLLEQPGIGVNVKMKTILWSMPSMFINICLSFVGSKM